MDSVWFPPVVGLMFVVPLEVLEVQFVTVGEVFKNTDVVTEASTVTLPPDAGTPPSQLPAVFQLPEVTFHVDCAREEP